jgi:hypothetical protein
MAERQSQREAMQAEYTNSIPTCEGADDCKAKWDAAQLWVVKNAGYKIQTATDVVIETYNPTESGVELAARVTKEPLGGGKYKILVRLWCNNIFGCSPNAHQAALAFNKAVGEATP